MIHHLFFAQLAMIDQLLHQRVILRQAAEAAILKGSIGTAVADVDHIAALRDQQHAD